jgi:hypothetical protein
LYMERRSSLDVKSSSARREKVNADKDSESKHGIDKQKDSSRSKDGKVRNEDTKHTTGRLHKEHDGRERFEKDRSDRHHHSREKDREGKMTGGEREKVGKDGIKTVEEKPDSRKGHHHSGTRGDRKASAVKEPTKLNSSDKHEPEAVIVDEQSSWTSPVKQSLHHGSSVKAADAERHSSPSRNKHSHSRASPPSARFELCHYHFKLWLTFLL